MWSYRQKQSGAYQKAKMDEIIFVLAARKKI